MDVSSFMHMAGSKRRKKALLLTLLEICVDQGLLGWFWQWQIDHVDRSLFAWCSREIFLWRSSREDKFTIVLVWVDCSRGSPLICATSRLPDKQTIGTSKNMFPLKYTPRFYSSGRWECVLKVDEKQMQYCFGNGLCSVEYVCYLIDTFSPTLQKLCNRILANKPISEFQRNSNLDFFCIGFVSWKNPSHIKNWLWNTRQKWKASLWLKPDYPVHFYCLLFTHKLVNKVRSALCFRPQVAKQKLTHHMSHQRGESGCLSVEKNHRNINRNYRENAWFYWEKHGKRDHRGPK